MARPAQLARASSESLRSIQSITSALTNGNAPTKPPLHPCAASSSLFFFAQGSSVVCVRYDSLELERRFERHTDNVTLIAVDNSSHEGGARVVSVDASREAIVWDSADGEELARFKPFEEIRVAAWMRNGHLACGDSKGNVILFDPSQNDSILAHTTSNSLSALAPSADCKTFALGYNNGSILVASLLPFTILYTLHTPSLPPSPIASLAWHASSSRQKADMLATQTRDGDLRVWSVSKAIEAGEPAKVVRVLSRPEGNRVGNNYCAWSMKGRVVQYTEGLAAIYDVRNKEVTSHPVETPPGVIGITVFATKGILFTVSEDFTVQQYDLYPPSVKNSVQHLPTVPPPSPPVSIEENKVEQFQDHRDQVIERYDARNDEYNMATMSPLGRIAHELEQLERMEANGLGIRGAETSRANSISSKSTAMSRRPSTASTRSNRSISSVSSFASSSSATSERSTTSDYSESNNATPIARVARQNSLGSGPILNTQQLPLPRRPHPLAQQVISSPIDHAQAEEPFDLFSNVKGRLPYVNADGPIKTGKLNEDDLRRELLYCIFGWKGDVDSLIRDELDSVDSRSLHAVMLRMWLGDLDQNSLSVLLGSDFQVSGDWLFVALSAMDGKQAWDTVARAFVMRLVQKGDIHTAAVVLLALANPKDAVDLYVSHKMFLEAIILAAYLWRNDWKLLSQLARKWGEHATSMNDTALAARCFACAGKELPEDLPSPSTPSSHKRQKSETDSISSFIRNLPKSSSPNPNTGSKSSLRLSVSSSPLKLITAFPSAEKGNPATATPTEKEKMPSIATRFFGWAKEGASIRSPVSTPIMNAASPPEQRRVFPSFTKSNSGTPKLPAVVENSTEQTPTQTRPSQGLPYETRLDLPVFATQPPPEPAQPKDTMVITGPVDGKSPAFTLGDRLAGGPVTLGDQLSRSGTPSASPNLNAGVAFNENIFRNGQGQSPSNSPGFRSSPAPEKQMSAQKPSGLHILWPTMDGVLRGETELPQPTIKPARSRSAHTSSNYPRALSRNGTRRGSGRDSDDSLPDIDERPERRSRSRRRAGSVDPRRRSYSRRPGQREPSENRGRSALRVQGNHIRSPSSPLPFSQQAELYKDQTEEEEEEAMDSFDDTYYSPRPRKRAESPEPTRGRSRGRSTGSVIRAPSQQLTLTADFYKADEDEVEEEEKVVDRLNQTRAKSQVRAESRPRAESRVRAESPPRAHSRIRAGSRIRAESPQRAHSRIRAGSRIRAQSPQRAFSRVRAGSPPRDQSRVRAESRRRRESPPRVRAESRLRRESPPRARAESRLRRESPPRAQSRARAESRLRRESPPRARAESRLRRESPPRAQSRARAESRLRRESPPRAHSRARGESRLRQVSPPPGAPIRTRAESRARRESPPRAQSRARGESRMRRESPPRVRAESRLRRESPPRAHSRARGESRLRQAEERGRSDLRVPNLMRSPSSPLPTSLEATYYRRDEDDEVYEAEDYYNQTSPPIRRRAESAVRGQNIRNESRQRGRQRAESRSADFDIMNGSGGLRRSRSERTLNEWVKTMDRSLSVDRRPSAPDLGGPPAAGLPATPKAWKGSLSRAQSPAATPSRGRSPAPGRSPLMSPPMTANSIDAALASVSPRLMQGMRAMSPSPRTIGARNRSASRGPNMGLPLAPGVMRLTEQYYRDGGMSDNVNDYPPMPTPPARSPSIAGARAIPSPTHPQGKHVPAPLKKTTFYPTPKAQAPNSPLPLPVGLPVHPALQIHLPASNGKAMKISGATEAMQAANAANNANAMHARSPSMRRRNDSIDLHDGMADSPVMGHSRSKSTLNHNNLIISIGMSPVTIEEEQKTGRMSPPVIGLGIDPRLGTPL